MCGATSQQNQIEAAQQSGFTTIQNEAQQLFGENSSLYNNLLASLEPILKAGPGQEGFSQQELTALNTEASTGVSSNYQNAEKAVRETGAAAGGGNEPIPSGAETQLAEEVGTAAAGQESAEESQITEANYATGRENYQGAVEGLLSAGNVFNPTEALNSEATGAGTAAANTANQIAQENFSPYGALIGAAGELGGAAIMA